MACCIVAALLISLYHRLAPRRARRADLDVGFAPAASRPAPGHGTGDHRTVRVTHDLGTRAAVAGWTLRFVAVGIAVYLPLSALLLAARVAEGDASTLSWLLRTAAALVMAGLAIRIASRIFRRGDDALTRSQIAGCAAVGISVAALELMALDMHVASLYHLHNATIHLVLHALPIAAAFVGLLLAFPSRLATNSPRQEHDVPLSHVPHPVDHSDDPVESGHRGDGDRDDGDRDDTRRTGIAALPVRSGTAAG